MPIPVPLLSSQRLKTELANAVNRHSNSSASARSAFAIWSTIARRCVSRSDQRLPVLPINEGLGPRNGRQPLANLLRNLARTLRTGQFQPQSPLDGSVIGAHLDQQFGQTCGSKGSKVLCIKGLVRSH